ncbi:tripartite tricarboxylate transporter TctB family protein [uncultured Roseibium sp.]|uniref:tripartite tricarboxylate transporter TctB family protein n=1 Tax=uncultured Roseibium sp. TaxID=1936171 RepID=UPI00260FAB1F|nr:tripartite tricarboxylate transporter TctB family protein [uncultured Roseibium sp.]
MQSVTQDWPGTARRALSGSVLLVAGLVMLLICWSYPVGNLTQMGPGYIPRVVGFLICALAVAIIAIDVATPEAAQAGRMHPRGLIFVSTAILLFAGLIDIAGLVPSMFLAVVVSMFADDEARPLPVLVYACLATLGGWLLFLVALELPIPAFWR